MTERLQKVMASLGVASRRASEALILAGRVTVNGRVVRELGAKADLTDDIRLDGQPLRRPEPRIYLALHKPAGYTSTVSDPHAARTIMELLPPATGRVFPAGRLDRESEGLLLLTDDGELTRRLLHPSFHLPKEYAVLVRGRITEATLRRLRRGAVVAGRQTTPVEVEPGEPPRWAGGPQPETMWLRFVLGEGRKRQIRETCAEAGIVVVRLIRTRIGPLSLGTLPPGKTRRLPAHEVAALRRAVGLEAQPPAAPDAAGAQARRRDSERPHTGKAPMERAAAARSPNATETPGGGREPPSTRSRRSPRTAPPHRGVSPGGPAPDRVAQDAGGAPFRRSERAPAPVRPPGQQPAGAGGGQRGRAGDQPVGAPTRGAAGQQRVSRREKAAAPTSPKRAVRRRAPNVPEALLRSGAKPRGTRRVRGT